MADEEITEEETPKKASKLPLVLGLVLALLGGGGGFYAVQSGLLLGSDADHAKAHDDKAEDSKNAGEMHTAMVSDVGFVPVDPLVISLGAPNGHLLFRAQLEVPSSYVDDVTKMMPRVVDVLNNYLRALEVEDLSNNASLTRLRAQMLRRVQVVTGAGRVDDLLIMEFVIN